MLILLLFFFLGAVVICGIQVSWWAFRVLVLALCLLLSAVDAAAHIFRCPEER